MSIRRRKKTRAFTQIDNAALRNPALSLKAKGLLAVMMSCPEDWQFYMDWLQQQSSDGRESHQTAMKELERRGYVVREKVQGKGGKFSGWEYLVDDEPLQASSDAESPKNGKAVSRQTTDNRENRQSVLPSDGFPATTNTDSTNIDLTKKESSSESATSTAPAAPLVDDDDLSPDGGTPEGLPEDTDAEGGEDLLLDQLVGSGMEGGESGTAEGVENVPPAAAAPVENPVENPGAHTWAILALEPIPLADLQARPARDPEGLKVLRALMQASSAKRLGHLREQLALPGTHRHLLP
ncbi:hypothetical protein IHN58_16045, partial [Deinococcus sp. 12RED42]|nr:hypothetical protein [Deinococcus sp. 12RED42]